MSLLNQDCLEHIFQFLEARDLIAISQVCKLWKLAAMSKEFHKLTYNCRFSYSDKPDIDRMSFEEFLEILKLISPKLKYAKIRKFRRKGDVEVAFGRFRYIVGVNEEQENILMNILVTRAESIETLKINSSAGVTDKQWENFFQVNRVTSFELMFPEEKDQDLFFNNYISILPNTLERIEIDYEWDLLNAAMDETKLLQLLQKQPRISTLTLLHDYDFPSFIATELAKHINSMTELSLSYRHYFLQDNDGNESRPTYNDTQILSIISKCKNLTKLKLNGFALSDANLCREIAQNCQSIRCLDLTCSLVPETNLKILMSLPNLDKLLIHPMKMTFTKEAEMMKNLVIIEGETRDQRIVDFDNLARALTLMPSLTSLTLHGASSDITYAAARSIKQIIHSRDQNIVLYSYDSLLDLDDAGIKSKKAVIPCSKLSSKNFAIFCWSIDLTVIKKLTKV